MKELKIGIVGLIFAFTLVGCGAINEINDEAAQQISYVTEITEVTDVTEPISTTAEVTTKVTPVTTKEKVCNCNCAGVSVTSISEEKIVEVTSIEDPKAAEVTTSITEELTTITTEEAVSEAVSETEEVVVEETVMCVPPADVSIIDYVIEKYDTRFNIGLCDFGCSVVRNDDIASYDLSFVQFYKQDNGSYFCAHEYCNLPDEIDGKNCLALTLRLNDGSNRCEFYLVTIEGGSITAYEFLYDERY